MKKKPKNKKKDSELTEIIHPESNFIQDVEIHVAAANITYQEAILHWLDKRGIEIEQVLPIIKSNLKFKKLLTLEAERLHCLKKGK